MYLRALTPNFFAAWVMVRNESLAVVPSSDFVCKLTSCLRFSTLAPSSASLLCNGNQEYFKTSRSSFFLLLVFSIVSFQQACINEKKIGSFIKQRVFPVDDGLF